MHTGDSTYSEDGLLPMRRHGYTEECYFNFTFTPVRGLDGHIEGVFNAVIETTFRVVSERRSRVLRELGHRTGAARTDDDLGSAVAETLGAAAHDVPFCLLYLAEPSGRGAAGRLRRHSDRWTGVAGTYRRPAVPIRGGHSPRLRPAGGPLLIDDLPSRFGQSFPGGAWPEASDGAFVIPLGAAGKSGGFLVLGKNPRRAVDDEYLQFVERAGSLVASALANVRDYEQERRRSEMLAELDRAKTVFFSNVSHELRTPLTLMVGPTEDALASPERALRGEDLEAVYRNELRLLRLVNALLEFSRIEAGRVHANYRPVDLAALTTELASMFRATMTRGGLRFEVDCPPLPEPVYVDPGMWEQVVMNLLSNAFKFTFTGGITVRLRARDGRAELVVSDTGTGIPEAELTRIFERFHRIEGARGRTFEGSGIGLALVDELLKLHAGNIAVSSRVGEGTTFTVSLPFGRDHLAPERVREAPPRDERSARADSYVEEARRWLPMPDEAVPLSADSRAPSAPSGDGARLLIADDNADMRDYLTRILAPHFQVRAVGNGLEALAAAKADSPDLVLSDVMMPVLDGFGLLRALREDPATAGIPFIMLSARAGEESRVEGLQAGADDYLVKPFGARELVARVTTHLQLSKLRNAAEKGRRRLYQLFEQAPVGIMVFEGPDLRVAFQNQSSREITGGRDILGLPVAEAFPQGVGTEALEGLKRVYATGQPESRVELPFSVLDANGKLESRYFTTHRQPLRDDTGQVVGVVAVGHDVTQEVTLRHAAHAANRAKDEFLAMLGHELRNPLSPIVTALQLLRMRGIDLRELSIIDRQVGHLIRLVDDLLDISRITRGKIELRKGRLELVQPVLRGLEMAGPLIEQRRQQIDFRVPPEGLPVIADPDRLAQIVSNLVTNACKYSEPGSRVTLLGERRDDRVVLRVIDQGIGLPPEMLDRIFDLFVQEPQAIDRSKGGLGLGLAIVRSLVGLHGGTVYAKSAGPGRGSELVVELPLAAEEGTAPDEGAADLPRTPERTPAPSPAAARVLVIDDNQDAAESIAELLGELGHQVVVAHDATSALRLASQLKPNVCLVDIGLPGMDGYELARRLRASGDLAPGARLVALTGYGRDPDRRRSLEAGFDKHVVKPVSLETLSKVVLN